MTASRWLPPLMVLTAPDGAAFREAIDRCFTETGQFGVLPVDCKIAFISGGVCRALHPRTALGLTRTAEART